MQTASCTVRLSGSRDNTVHKPSVTVAEIAILRAIHGSESVTNIVTLENDKRPHRAERERLEKLYGKATDAADKRVIDLVFPGINTPLPNTLADIGLAEQEEDEEVVVSGKKPKSAARTISAADLTDDDKEAGLAAVAAGAKL